MDYYDAQLTNYVTNGDGLGLITELRLRSLAFGTCTSLRPSIEWCEVWNNSADYTHTHTYTHIYIYIYIYVCVITYPSIGLQEAPKHWTQGSCPDSSCSINDFIPTNDEQYKTHLSIAFFKGVDLTKSKRTFFHSSGFYKKIMTDDCH